MLYSEQANYFREVKIENKKFLNKFVPVLKTVYLCQYLSCKKPLVIKIIAIIIITVDRLGNPGPKQQSF